MKSIATLAFLLQAILCFSQERKKVEASYSMVLSRTATIEKTEALCLEQARLKAIGDEFGYVVSETTISNVNDSNGKVNDQFSVLTNTSVKGEWIKDTAPVEIVWECAGKDYQVTVKVQGEVRAIKKEGKTKLNFFSCSPYDVTVQKFIFKNNELLNCSVTSSQTGYVSIYYLDHTSNEAIRLLPSASYNHLDGVEIKPDTPYILFNKAYTNQFKEMSSNASELILGLPDGKEQIIDEIVVIYSPEPFAKPVLSKDKSTNELPTLKISEFEKWKTDLISRNSEVVTATVAITIMK